MSAEEAGGGVTCLTEARKTMRFPAVRQVLAYWEGLRAGRAVPLRSEIDPRGIEGALEYAFILERIAPQVARFRLAGTHLSDLMGMEVRGMPITSLFTAAARDRVAERVEAVFKGPETAELSLTSAGTPGKPALEARLLLLPLKSDLGDISRAIGCLVTDGSIGRAPRRFDLGDARIALVEAGRTLGPTHLSLHETPGLAEAPVPFAGAPEIPRTGERRSYLRLVKSDD
jgi:hypothetical protein